MTVGDLSRLFAGQVERSFLASELLAVSLTAKPPPNLPSFFSAPRHAVHPGGVIAPPYDGGLHLCPCWPCPRSRSGGCGLGLPEVRSSRMRSATSAEKEE